jgi:sucrose-6-phosphate hydrolase SacC (GH32 family)
MAAVLFQYSVSPHWPLQRVEEQEVSVLHKHSVVQVVEEECCASFSILHDACSHQQQAKTMTMPLDLKLVSTKDGPRLSWSPVREMESLRSRKHDLGKMTLASDGANPLKEINGELLELQTEFEPGDASEIAFRIRGLNVVYDVKKQEIVVNGHRAAAPLQGGRQKIVILADRTGLEVFASGGLTVVPMPVNLPADDLASGVRAIGGPVRFHALEIHALESAWNSATESTSP